MQTFERFSYDLYPSNDSEFDEIALNLFQYQAVHNQVYRSYLTILGVDSRNVKSVDQIPFLPVTLFKTHRIMTDQWDPEVTFTSSGTSGAESSRHEVRSLRAYLQHTVRIFESSIAPLSSLHVLCLLPSYLERTGSSLVAMANHFIAESGSGHSGFYLHDMDALAAKLESLRGGKKVLLLGVSFALWEMAERYDMDLSHCIVMETGGMKGRRKEIVREELHDILCTSFRVKTIYSEYGMTEMLSQAYSNGGGLFTCPPSMRVVIREVNDPFCPEKRSTGIINVIDLANADSCAFIETQDLGITRQHGHFEVLGRKDNSDVRGCNLLVN